MKTITIVPPEDLVRRPPPGQATGTPPSSFTLALLEGTECSALSSAVASRLGITNNSFYLTIGPNATDTVLPLSCSLPDQMKLYLHLSASECGIQNQETNGSSDQPPGKDAHSSPPFAKDKSTPVVYNNTHQATQDDDNNGNFVERQKGIILRTRDLFFTGMYRNLYGAAGSDSPDSATALQGMTNDIYSFNQLGSDLANERTFLAWIRTMLACIRTIFSYEKIQETGFRDKSLVVAIMMMATMLLMTGILSMQRYYATRKLLFSSRDDKPKTYNMITLFPFILLGFATAVVTSVATYTGNWWD